MMDRGVWISILEKEGVKKRMFETIEITSLDVKLASMIVHLAEYIETKEQKDLLTARSLLSNSEVKEFFDKAEELQLVPLPREPLSFFKE